MTVMIAKILSIDNGGNVYFDSRIFSCFSLGDAVSLLSVKCRINMIPFYSGLYCATSGTVLVSRNDKVYLAIRHGNAARAYGLNVGQEVLFNLEKPGYFWEKENAYSFEEINEKNFYKDTESFANFRPLFSGSSDFYRSSSPIDDAYGRSEAVVHCIEKYSIKTILDISDSNSELAQLLNVTNDKNKSILSTRSLMAIGSDTGLYSKEFEGTIAEAIRGIISLETPCLIHCRAGKRRTGFICAILQSLAGFDIQSIIADYMQSYKNNNGITRENNSSRYDYLTKDTIGRILSFINGDNLNNLAHTTELYLKKIGITNQELAALKSKICH